nr:neutral/alkaline non-lysosomal ceramidase N-terminal domain-containing protein [Clostridia bacterium]
MSKQFVLGKCKRRITPPLGTPLYGYPNYEQRKAASVHDDLYVNVAAFGYDKPSALLIGMDICAVREALVNRITSLINETVGISKDSIMIAAIHTHSGPCVTSTAGWGVSNDSYIDDILIPATLEAVTEAVNNFEPALLGVGTTHSNVGINRRQILPDGKVALGQNPYGCYDPEMTVLKFVSPDKKPLLNIVHYGAHPTSASSGLEITRDWPGIMVDRLETESGAMSFFINGAEGDVGPRLSNGRTTGVNPITKKPDFSYVCEVGGMAAIDAARAYNSIKEYHEVDFKTISGTLKIPYCEFPPREKIESELNRLESITRVSLDIIKYEILKKQLAILDSGEEPKTCCELAQVLFAFNSTVIVPFQFEVFSEITVRLRQYSPFAHTLCTCNTN